MSKIQVRQTLASRILTVTLYAVFVAGVVLIVTLPFLLDYYMRVFYDAYQLAPGYRVFITAFLMMVGGLGEWIVLEVIGMLRTIPTDPFVDRNTRALRRVGTVALATAGLFFAKCCLYITFMTLVFGVFLLVCSLIAFTLGSLFRQAVAYREENDLTI